MKCRRNSQAMIIVIALLWEGKSRSIRVHGKVLPMIIVAAWNAASFSCTFPPAFSQSWPLKEDGKSVCVGASIA